MLNIFISNFFILSMFSYLGYSNLKLRNPNNKNNLIIFILFLFMVNLTNFNGPSSIGLILLVMIHLVYFFIMFKGSLFNCLLVVLPFPLIIITSEFFIANILNMLTGIDTRVDINSGIYLFAIILSNIVISLILISYVKLSKLFIKKTLPRFTWVVFILPISTLVFLMNLKETRFYMISQNNLFFVSIIGLLISNFVILFIFYKVIVSYEYKKELNDMKNKEILLNMKYNLIKDHQDTNLNFLHDLLHKCRELNNDLEKRKYDNLRLKFTHLYETTFKEFNMLYSNSIIINSLISERLSKIHTNKINIKTVIEYNDFTFLSLDEQINIFSTILDQAILSSSNMKSKNRNIILKTSKKQNQIIFQILYSSNKDSSSINIITSVLQQILLNHNAIISDMFDENHNTVSLIIVFSKPS